MPHNRFGPAALSGADRAEVEIRRQAGHEFRAEPLQPQLQGSIGARAARLSADPVFRRKVLRATRSDRLKVEFAAELVARFGVGVVGVLDRFGGLPDAALAVTHSDELSPVPLYRVAL